MVGALADPGFPKKEKKIVFFNKTYFWPQKSIHCPQKPMVWYIISHIFYQFIYFQKNGDMRIRNTVFLHHLSWYFKNMNLNLFSNIKCKNNTNICSSLMYDGDPCGSGSETLMTWIWKWCFLILWTLICLTPPFK